MTKLTKETLEEYNQMTEVISEIDELFTFYEAIALLEEGLEYNKMENNAEKQMLLSEVIKFAKDVGNKKGFTSIDSFATYIALKSILG